MMAPVLMEAGRQLGRRSPALRRFVRRSRKAAKRLGSYVSLAGLWVRNRFSTAPVLGSAPVVVSLTSYGPRIRTVAFAIESIARGRLKPQRMILWLQDEDLQAGRPESLRRLEARGLEIRLCDNFGPHTKSYPYVETMGPHLLPLVTADDDIIYPPGWLQGLYEAYDRHPEEVSCYWANVIGIDGGHLREYARWSACRDTTVRAAHFALGVSGVIYPPALLTELARGGREFMELCPRADDIWMHRTALRAGVRVRQLSATPRHFAMIPGTQKQSLTQDNVYGNRNDQYLNALYTDRDLALLEQPTP